MKARRKIDQKAIKQFFIDHTEKIMIGVVGLLFAFFTYKAVMLQMYEGYKLDSTALAADTKRAEEAMQRGPTSTTPEKEAPVPPYDKMIEDFKRPIGTPVYSYTMSTGFVWKPYAPPPLRDTPEVFVVDDLRAVPGRGALAVNQQAGAANKADTEGQRWVVVTGLIPRRKEIAEYHSKFDGTADESHMDPVYVGFMIQRGDVAPGSKEPVWEKTLTLCTPASFADQFAKWAGTAPEVVEPMYVSNALTSPLPPLVNGTWGEEVAHAPKIKLAPVAVNPAPGQGAPPMNVPGADLHGRGRPAVRTPEGAAAGPAPFGPPPMGPAPGGDAAPEDFLNGSAKPKTAVAKNDPNDEATIGPEYLLLRYFDTDVEPNKQYAYRVFVLLANPNYGLPNNVLVEAELARPRVLGPKGEPIRDVKSGRVIWWDTNPDYAKWSSHCISPKLPGDRRLLAGPTIPPKAPAPQEFTGEARVLLWAEKSGLNLNFSAPGQYRGTVLSFPKADMKNVNGQKTRIDPLDTNAVLVDVAGGDLLNPKDRDRSLANLGPGMILVLDESGNLVLHDEMGESKEWTENTKEPERPRGPRGPGPDGPDIPGHHGPRGAVGPSPTTGPSESAMPDMNDQIRKRTHGGH